MDTKLNLSEQKSELKRLELATKDQKIMMAQYFGHIHTRMEIFAANYKHGKYFFVNLENFFFS